MLTRHRLYASKLVKQASLVTSAMNVVEVKWFGMGLVSSATAVVQPPVAPDFAMREA